MAASLLLGCGSDETEPLPQDTVEYTATEAPRGPDAVYLRFEGASLESVPDGTTMPHRSRRAS